MHIIEEFGPAGVPSQCTLPTPEQPLRFAEFQDLFASAAGVERLSPARLRVRWAVGVEIADWAHDLAARESSCCSFFTFDVTEPARAGGTPATLMTIEVPSAHTGVLDAVERLARTSAAPERA